MTLTLKRTSKDYAGVFGILASEDGKFSCVTLEHAYPVFDNNFTSKIPVGTYVCKIGSYRLEGMTQSFQTYEIMEVPAHTDILYHWGNYNKDSAGCILLGKTILIEGYQGPKMITESKVTFQDFMTFLAGVDQFTLVVC